MNPRISVLHSSARPENWRAVYDQWISSAADAGSIQYALVCDRRWGFTELPQLRPQDVVLWNDGRRCFVDGYNTAAKAATGDILVCPSDDQFSCGEGWDESILLMARKWGHVNDTPWPHLPFLLHANTGTPAEFDRKICVMPIMSRALYEKWGYVFYPGYESMYADNDLYEHAQAEGVLIDWRDSPVFPHKHAYWNTDVPNDKVYEAQNRAEAYQIGNRLLMARRANGFREAKSAPKPASIIVCLPGESFRREWLHEFIAMDRYLLSRFGPANVHYIDGYTSDPAATRHGMYEGLKKFALRPDLVLWIDDDNPPEWEKLKLLVDDLDEHPNLDGIGAWCWCQEGDSMVNVHVSCGVFADDGGMVFFDSDVLENGEQEILAGPIATGFPMFLHRMEVLDKLGPHPFLRIPAPQFDYGCVGEDVSFCKRALEAGLTFAIDRRAEVNHLKVRRAGPPRVSAGEPAKPEPAPALSERS